MSGLQKKYYDGFQVIKIITEVVDDQELGWKIIKRFAKEPSAERLGEWEFVGKTDFGDFRYECSECGYQSNSSVLGRCPRCKVRMANGDE